jgi:uncharacterized protein (TIGR02996 family)
VAAVERGGVGVTTEDDFQAALDANPGDHHTRLVFADWLEERGDERAEGYRYFGRYKRRPKSEKCDGSFWQWWRERYHRAADRSAFLPPSKFGTRARLRQTPRRTARRSACMTDADREYLRAHATALRHTRVADLVLWLLAERESTLEALCTQIALCDALAERVTTQAEILARRALRPVTHPCG